MALREAWPANISLIFLAFMLFQTSLIIFKKVLSVRPNTSNILFKKHSKESSSVIVQSDSPTKESTKCLKHIAKFTIENLGGCFKHSLYVASP